MSCCLLAKCQPREPPGLLFPPAIFLSLGTDTTALGARPAVAAPPPSGDVLLARSCETAASLLLYMKREATHEDGGKSSLSARERLVSSGPGDLLEGVTDCRCGQHG